MGHHFVERFPEAPLLPAKVVSPGETLGFVGTDLDSGRNPGGKKHPKNITQK